MKYIELQNEIISRYNIEICNGEKCPNDWRRTHAHVAERRVCKWEQKNSVVSTFTLLHEIGHIETGKSSMRRCESEYFATVWALRTAREYGIKIPEKLIDRYQNYIMLEYSRGIRRGGRLPPPTSFRLPRY
ncbi:MAG: hypothetical protein NC319_05330 [Butyricicoccus sp.]|nr:hypothetical protein [Butyricicoccus sp.]